MAVSENQHENSMYGQQQQHISPKDINIYLYTSISLLKGFLLRQKMRPKGSDSSGSEFSQFLVKSQNDPFIHNFEEGGVGKGPRAVIASTFQTHNLFDM